MSARCLLVQGGQRKWKEDRDRRTVCPLNGGMVLTDQLLGSPLADTSLSRWIPGFESLYRNFLLFTAFIAYFVHYGCWESLGGKPKG